MSIGVRPYVPGPPDAHGNPTDSWGPPVAVPVHGVAPRLQETVEERRRWLMIEGLDVYAPAGTSVGVHDRVEWGGALYCVDGDIADWSYGPWVNPAAGVVIHLKQARG